MLTYYILFMIFFYTNKTKKGINECFLFTDEFQEC